jgi:PAS domain S-box-containing protein
MTPEPTYGELVQRVKALEKEAQKRQAAEEKIKKQSDFLSLILESLSHPFYVIDVKDYTLQLANSAAKAEGITENATCYALTHKRQTPCDSAEHPCPLETLKQTKKPVTVEHIHYGKRGEPKHVEVHAHPILDEEGNLTQVIEYSLDITKRKQIEEALRESELKFRSVTESAKDAIISADKHGNIIYWNKASQEMFGFEEQEILGQPLTVLMPDSFSEAHQKAIASHARTGVPKIIGQTVELIGRSKQGLEFPIELSVSTWKTGGEVYYTGIIRDISERKQIEEERNQLIESLQESLAKVKTLSGLLPICASCKKIRDDNGYWNQIETYIRNHSEAEFSHGICPECTRKLYPELSKKIHNK